MYAYIEKWLSFLSSYPILTYSLGDLTSEISRLCVCLTTPITARINPPKGGEIKGKCHVKTVYACTRMYPFVTSPTGIP